MIKKLHERAALIRAVRFFFETKNYLEVETPLRNPVLIPEANIGQVPSGNSFLQTSPELCMKRLLASGYEKLFQICKCFRMQERGARHLPEFTMLEWYRVDGEYQSLMAETVELLMFVAQQVAGFTNIDRRLVSLLKQPATFITVRAAFLEFTNSTAEEALADGCFDELLVEFIEPNLGFNGPCFLYDYPVQLGSLARKKKDDPTLVERFELYLNGVEVANGFSELTSAPEQRLRFTKELGSAGNEGGMPEKFLQDLERMPEACGIALGLDRLVMLFTGTSLIDEVVSFTPEEL